jgi:hypothetical protein
MGVYTLKRVWEQLVKIIDAFSVKIFDWHIYVRVFEKLIDKWHAFDKR